MENSDRRSAKGSPSGLPCISYGIRWAMPACRRYFTAKSDQHLGSCIALDNISERHGLCF